MQWPLWLATVEEAARLLDGIAQDLTDIEDEASETLAGMVAELIADDGIIELLRQRVAEQEETDAELAKADAAEYEASLVPEPDDEADEDLDDDPDTDPED